MKRFIVCAVLAGTAALFSCRSGYTLVSVEGGRVSMTAAYDVQQDAEALQILQPFQLEVDSMMSPVIGTSAGTLIAERPESPLSNLIADILLNSAEEKTGQKADIAVMNMGGIRNILNEGDITVGTIYEISPFQNALAVVTMSGEVLLDLFKEIAAVHGEGISGARLVISKEGELLEARVGGSEIDPRREYTVATIDYIAEGNDRMEAFKRASGKLLPEDAVLRDLFVAYVKQCQAEGRPVDAKTEGRIVVQ